MHPQSLLVILASAICSVAAAPTDDHPESIWSGLYNITDAAAAEDSLLSLEKRDSCGAGNRLLSKSSINNLMWDLQNNNPDGMTYLGHGSGTSWVNGEARVCVDNTYLTENTHVKRWEIGWAVGYIRDMCCTASGNPQW
ncbi:hypothetical protein ColTof4_12967 [Colletotrichum tofieldiae]|uniref:Secreted protein n=1 Tax=Colletotrichum tofieldiae TaxID=708197 RepID=A0A161YP03_9PEZI|nr:hypothetical protein CT0861_04688 [Colletotrichum tofieldiae]GKT66842.1 hypothetical protein ColTof3_14181 [Colletotrichum tofieldiae]GKT80544.1 hypothetical protein ColTof4_12967 [Colletotrichum tofieldiae]GKT94902.1 hypothetical protein Ct61P_12752 [Colletotrichum tofieldiae]